MHVEFTYSQATWTMDEGCTMLVDVQSLIYNDNDTIY